eukprot:7138337-Pyramimonas_sp.AAC.1
MGCHRGQARYSSRARWPSGRCPEETRSGGGGPGSSQGGAGHPHAASSPLSLRPHFAAGTLVPNAPGSAAASPGVGGGLARRR